jgi:hypothetical protein
MPEKWCAIFVGSDPGRATPLPVNQPPGGRGRGACLLARRCPQTRPCEARHSRERLEFDAASAGRIGARSGGTLQASESVLCRGCSQGPNARVQRRQS